MWRGEGAKVKGQGQRKRRSDSCINNVRLSLNCATKECSPPTEGRQSRAPHAHAHARPPRRAAGASLDDVSADPWGPEGQRSRRSTTRGQQLIPRAKLRLKRPSVENLYDLEGSQRRRHSTLIPPDHYHIDHYCGSRKKEREYFYSSLQHFPETGNRTDSLDSNYNNRTSLNSFFAVSYEDLQELSLPNYYPEARYDTDNTDNISLNDNISSNSLDRYSNEVKRERYDENIVLSTNKNLYEAEYKPKTIRNPTGYSDNYGKINPNLQLTLLVQAEEKCLEKTNKETDQNNEDNKDADQVIREEKYAVIEERVSEEVITNEETVKESKTQDQIKTLIEVIGETQEFEQYKTVVSVDTAREKPENIGDTPCKHTNKVSKTHSHNYLKEFLETQKGSKKPLQNFIAKKFSNLSRKTTGHTTNLQDNKFHSLPDITASKNLRKCEKIDRKLRKCEKNNSCKSENRFIVNIGRHFDITTDSEPVDFEVQICKVPKKKKNAITSDESFIEAVKNLKETIHGSQKSLEQKPNDSKENTDEMALLYCQDECSKELNEKLGTMKSYWKKMIGTENEESKEQENETCKVIEVTTKVEDVKKKFEQEEKLEEKPHSKVQLTKQLFEPKLASDKTGKISPTIKETCSYFENKNVSHENDRSFESLCPTSVEIIDAGNDNDKSLPKTRKPLSKSNSISVQPEFDHVRYKLVKSDLFRKKIFANCEKESQFEDLIQYLQDYSFQELLIDNSIVVIEPIRSKVPHPAPVCSKSMKNITPLVHKNPESSDNKATLNRPFFYHPIRVNKEVNEDELPNPDTVRQVRQFFEGGPSKEQPRQETKEINIDPDKDRCSASDSTSLSDLGSQEHLYESLDNEICCEYVSEAILEKIREYGTTVTYYGGRVVDQKSGQPVLTRAIMEEIRDNEKRCMDCSNCRKLSNGGVDEAVKESKDKENFRGMKFRLLKSNSCSSRLELVGTNNLQLVAQQRKGSVLEEGGKVVEQNNRFNEKNAINENIKKQTMNNNSSPKIIGEEMKVNDNKTQWRVVNENSIKTMNDKSPTQTIYDFYHYDKVKSNSKKIDDMEFESYEVA